YMCCIDRPTVRLHGSGVLTVQMLSMTSRNLMDVPIIAVLMASGVGGCRLVLHTESLGPLLAAGTISSPLSVWREERVGGRGKIIPLTQGGVLGLPKLLPPLVPRSVHWSSHKVYAHYEVIGRKIRKRRHARSSDK
ncbi:hypothetical protein KUCAC02_001845, partial [Chaenocephalus aceratus]